MERKIISGIWGRYSITKDGRVYNERFGRVCRPTPDRQGYLRVALPVDLGISRTFRVHNLVYTNFIGPVPDGMEIDHINRDKTDNRLDNLRLVTARDNSHNSVYNGTRRRGIYFSKQREKWIAAIHIDGKRHYIGIYENEDEALAAYNEARANWELQGILPAERPKPDKYAKHCSGCGKVLPREAFYYLPRYKRYSALCRDCHCEKMREYRKAQRSAK